MLPMPAAAHLVPVALVLAVMTPHPSDSVSVAYDVYLITTKKCYFVDLIIMVLSTFE